MLKFIETSDFQLPEAYRYNEDDSVAWVYTTPEAVHTGVIRKGMTRTKQVQTGTQIVVIGQKPVLDVEGNPVIDENGEPVMQDVTEEHPIFETQTVDVWANLLESGVAIQAYPLDSVKQAAYQQINNERDILISGGVQFNGHTYQTDEQSIMDLMGAVIAQVDTQWLTADNTVVNMTATDLALLGQAVAAHKKEYVYKARLHKDVIAAMTSKEEIDTYLSTLSW